jgi:hypothetical protein
VEISDVQEGLSWWYLMEYEGDKIREYYTGGTRRTHGDIRKLRKNLTGKAKE